MGSGASKHVDPIDPVDTTVDAIKKLQESLHSLTPHEQSRVKNELDFATEEWQQGLALSIRKKDTVLKVSNRLGRISREGSVPSAAEAQEAKDRSSLTPDSGKLILCMVGLPATGKSTIVHKLHQFLGWRGYDTRPFSVGAWRRGEQGNAKTGITENVEEDQRALHSSASFFNSTKGYAAATREQVTVGAFNGMVQWLHEGGGQIAIFDASNVTASRRTKLQSIVNNHGKEHPETTIGLVFIESIVTDPRIVEKEMLWKVRHSNDFRGMSESDAMDDLRERITYYEEKYETVGEAEGAFIKIFDMKAKVHVSNIYGRMAKTVLPYMLAMHAEPRPIFLCVVDEEAQGTDETLHASLTKWASTCEYGKDLLILTSTMPRAMSAAAALTKATGAKEPACRGQLAPIKQASSLVSAVAQPDGSFKKVFGESVANLVGRLEPIALEIEGSTSPVIVLAHEAPCRTLRALFLRSNATDQLISAREAVDATFSAASDNGVLLFEYQPNTDTASFDETVHTL